MNSVNSKKLRNPNLLTFRLFEKKFLNMFKKGEEYFMQVEIQKRCIEPQVWAFMCKEIN